MVAKYRLYCSKIKLNPNLPVVIWFEAVNLWKELSLECTGSNPVWLESMEMLCWDIKLLWSPDVLFMPEWVVVLRVVLTLS